MNKTQNLSDNHTSVDPFTSLPEAASARGLRDVVLHLKNIAKEYRQGKNSIDILESIDLKVEAGELIAIVGASGCGKSTLLHIAGLLDSPSSGEVIFPNLNLSKNLIRLQYIGFIYQHHYLLSDFSARENVALPQLINGVSMEEALIKADELLGRLELSKKTYSMPGELSGGQQQRVAIARSLANDPKIILADEPTGNLDPSTAEEVFQLFVQLAKEQNTAVVMVTHNYELANRMHKVYSLDHGKLSSFTKNNK